MTRRGLATAVIIGVALAAYGGHGQGGSTTAPPPGGPYTPRSWAVAFLRENGLPVTRCNVVAVVAWERAEGGNWANSAQFNPLNTTQVIAGSWAMNPVGVQAYPSWRKGLRANTQVLHNGLYGPVIAALEAGDNAQAVADAVAASPWGTAPFTTPRC